MTLREALTVSQNVPAVKILSKLTPQVGYNYLEKFGISTLVSPKNAINGAHDVVQSLALGGMTRGVSNIDMCSAYAAIANKGTYTSLFTTQKCLIQKATLLSIILYLKRIRYLMRILTGFLFRDYALLLLTVLHVQPTFQASL